MLRRHAAQERPGRRRAAIGPARRPGAAPAGAGRGARASSSSARCATTRSRRSTPSGCRSRPSTDAALMLGLAHTLVAEGLHDRAFLDRCTVGFDRFEAYLLGAADGHAKDAAWAAAITGLRRGAHPRARPPRWRPGARMLIGQLVAAARRPRRAALLAGDRAGRDARPDRPAGRRLRLRLRGRERRRPARPARSPGRPCRRAATRSSSLHPGGAHHATCCSHPGEPFDFDGRRLHLPGHPARLLGRRQPVPPPPGPRTGCVRAWQRPETVIVQRALLERAGAARRHRAAGHHALSSATTSPARRATTTWSRCTGSSTRSARPGTTTRSSPASPSAWVRARRSPRAATPGTWLRWLYDRGPAAGRGARTSTCRSSTSSGPQGVFRLPPRADPEILMAGFRADPEGAAAARPPRARSRSSPRRIAVVRLRRLPRPPGLARAGGVAGLAAGGALPAPPGLEPAEPRSCTASTTSGPTARRRQDRAAASRAAHPPRRRGGARHRRRRPRAGLQRPRRLPGRRRVVDEAVMPGVVRAADRRLVRPGGARRCRHARAARQPERADAGQGQLAAGAGAGGAQLPGRGRALRGRGAAGGRVRPAALRGGVSRWVLS